MLTEQHSLSLQSATVAGRTRLAHCDFTWLQRASQGLYSPTCTGRASLASVPLGDSKKLLQELQVKGLFERFDCIITMTIPLHWYHWYSIKGHWWSSGQFYQLLHSLSSPGPWKNHACLGCFSISLHWEEILEIHLIDFWQRVSWKGWCFWSIVKATTSWSQLPVKNICFHSRPNKSCGVLRNSQFFFLSLQRLKHSLEHGHWLGSLAACNSTTIPFGLLM